MICQGPQFLSRSRFLGLLPSPLYVEVQGLLRGEVICRTESLEALEVIVTPQ